jgi:uridine phosphorylase
VSKNHTIFDSIEFSTQRNSKPKRDGKISVMSTGGDNIDIVINELDALVNIDLETRRPKKR